LPHFQTLIRYEATLGPLKLTPFFNGFVQQVGRAGTNETRSPWGAGGGLDVETSVVKVGVGGSTESGTTLYVPLFGAEAIDGSGTLRKGASLYAQGMVTLGSVDVSGGFGFATLDRTTFDTAQNLNINKRQQNLYGAVQYHLAQLTFVAEINLLHHQWHLGNTQDVTVFTLGADFEY
jgi:hypothetical protein